MYFLLNIYIYIYNRQLGCMYLNVFIYNICMCVCKISIFFFLKILLEFNEGFGFWESMALFI